MFPGLVIAAIGVVIFYLGIRLDYHVEYSNANDEVLDSAQLNREITVWRPSRGNIETAKTLWTEADVQTTIRNIAAPPAPAPATASMPETAAAAEDIKPAKKPETKEVEEECPT